MNMRVVGGVALAVVAVFGAVALSQATDAPPAKASLLEQVSWAPNIFAPSKDERMKDFELLPAVRAAVVVKMMSCESITDVCEQKFADAMSAAALKLTPADLDPHRLADLYWGYEPQFSRDNDRLISFVFGDNTDYAAPVKMLTERPDPPIQIGDPKIFGSGLSLDDIVRAAYVR